MWLLGTISFEVHRYNFICVSQLEKRSHCESLARFHCLKLLSQKVSANPCLWLCEKLICAHLISIGLVHEAMGSGFMSLKFTCQAWFNLPPFEHECTVTMTNSHSHPLSKSTLCIHTLARAGIVRQHCISESRTSIDRSFDLLSLH
jgi:hypothetical protein